MRISFIKVTRVHKATTIGNDNLVHRAISSTIFRHFENRRGEGPAEEVVGNDATFYSFSSP